ncbi:MAG: hypothetical protein AAF993_16875 [Pseudomonadota bacterium]
MPNILHRWHRKTAQRQTTRVLAFSFACAVLFGAQWIAVTHAHEECHEHVCMACGLSNDDAHTAVNLLPTASIPSNAWLTDSLSNSLTTPSAHFGHIRAPPSV